MTRQLRKKSVIVKSLLRMIIVSVVLVVLTNPEKALSWNCSNTDDLWPTFNSNKYTHQWIVGKAIKYLRHKGLLPDCPLEQYEYDIKYGTFFADYPYPTIKADPNAIIKLLHGLGARLGPQ